MYMLLTSSRVSVSAGLSVVGGAFPNQAGSGAESVKDPMRLVVVAVSVRAVLRSPLDSLEFGCVSHCPSSLPEALGDCAACSIGRRSMPCLYQAIESNLAPRAAGDGDNGAMPCDSAGGDAAGQ